jgi:hypothetical protein
LLAAIEPAQKKLAPGAFRAARVRQQGRGLPDELCHIWKLEKRSAGD